MSKLLALAVWMMLNNFDAYHAPAQTLEGFYLGESVPVNEKFPRFLPSWG